MSSKFLSVTLAIFVLCSAGISHNANAGLIAGEVYLDSSGERWEYVSAFDMASGTYWENATPFNGLEAAAQIEGPGDYAVSAFADTFIIDSIQAGDVIVNHLAWYDQYQASYIRDAENATANVGAPGYSEFGDKSAWILDRAQFIENKTNYIFKQAADVPEPSTIAILALALAGLGVRRLKS